MKHKYCALLSDYYCEKGQGDALEVSGGKVLYHVGYCDQKDDLSKEMQQKTKDLSCEEADYRERAREQESKRAREQ